jgi:hypothetical protein
VFVATFARAMRLFSLQTVLLMLLLVSGGTALAQEAATIDTTKTAERKEKTKGPHNPKKATIMSAALPGLGQVYNGKWWKVPIIYGGFAGLTYMAVNNHVQMTRYRDAYLLRHDDDPDTVDEFDGRYSDANLRELKTTSQRSRDLSFIIMGLLYVLNIIDANVDGHLKDFDVSEDLSLRIRPMMQQQMVPGQLPTPGITMTFTVR